MSRLVAFVAVSMVLVSKVMVLAYDGSEQGLTKVPSYIPLNETSVNLAANKIIDTSLLSSFTELVNLELTSNSIETFPYLERSGESLKMLYLGQNSIRAIPKSSLQPLSALEYLNVAENLLPEFPDLAPVAMTLEYLDISDNYFAQFEEQADRMAVLQSMQSVILSRNQFTEMPFLGGMCQNLPTLYFNENLITTIDPKAFELCTMAWKLNLHDNQLTTFPDLRYLGETLTEVIISQNKLYEISPDILDALVALETLNLDENSLTEFPNLCPIGGTLTKVSISKNQLFTIKELNLDCLVGLEILTLSHNQLTAIPDAAGPGQKLVSLDLAYNRFTSMPVLEFLGGQLTNLTMKHNSKMTEISDKAIEALSSIVNLELKNCGMTSIPNLAPVIDTLEKVVLSNLPITTVTPENVLVLGSIPIVKLKHGSLATLPFVCMFPGNQLRLRDNPLDLCSCDMNWIRETTDQYPDAVDWSADQKNITCGAKNKPWLEYLQEECSKGEDFGDGDGTVLSAGGTLFSSSTGYVCPSLAIPMNDASEIPVSEDSAEEDCMLWCVQTPGCSAVRVHTTGSATCQLGVVVPGSKTPVEMANGWETYAGSSVKNGHVDENF